MYICSNITILSIYHIFSKVIKLKDKVKRIYMHLSTQTGIWSEDILVLAVSLKKQEKYMGLKISTIAAIPENV